MLRGRAKANANANMVAKLDKLNRPLTSTRFFNTWNTHNICGPKFSIEKLALVRGQYESQFVTVVQLSRISCRKSNTPRLVTRKYEATNTRSHVLCALVTQPHAKEVGGEFLRCR